MPSRTASVNVLLGCCMLSAVLQAQAAESISNSFKGFSGSSGSPGTQSALASAGFAVTDTSGSGNPILFDASGANFGSSAEGDAGRNYVRTIAADYATVSFEALITIQSTSTDQQAYFGLGNGEIALWGTPDWSTQLSSTSAWIADVGTQLVTFRTQDDTNEFHEVDGSPSLGIHRVRMVFNSVAKTMNFSIDLNYSGGAFVADVTAPAVNVSTLFGPTGWPSEPARIFFGGDDQMIFSDLVVSVVSPLVFEDGFENP